MINTDRIVTHEPRWAAGPWNYDMSTAPKDGTIVLLAWGENPIGVWTMMYRECDEYGDADFPMWTDGDGCYIDADTPFAWAAINLPEVPK